MTEHKIQTLEELSRIVKKLQEGKKTVAQCHGTFDLMHPGHIKHFEAAKRLADVLVVTVTPDRFVKKGPGRPVFNEKLRMESIAALLCVDFVALDTDAKPLKAIEMLKPDVFVKGGDYAGKEFEVGHAAWEEKQLTDAYGGKYHHTNEPVVFSSSKLLNEYFSPFPEETQKFLQNLKSRYSFDYISSVMDRMSGVRVLVVGDAILDVYNYCSPLGRSVKEEIPRVKVEDSEMFAGGSVAVANTLAGFCKTVGLASVFGAKDAERDARHAAFIRQALREGVRAEFFMRPDAPTVVNERFVNKNFINQRYFGMYHIESRPMDAGLESAICKRLAAMAEDYDMILVMDYGLGMMTRKLIETIANLGKFMAVNTQTNSANMGYNYITKYPRADYLSISQPELRLAFQAQHDSLENLLRRAAQHLKTRTISLTLASRGALMYDARSDAHHTIPVFSQQVVDRIGAGDAYLAVTAPAVFFGDVPPDLVGFLGNIAGAIACTIVANRETIDREKLLRSVQTVLK